MQKVAVFGNAGGGKSTLSKRLSEITGLPLHILDKIKYRPGGSEAPDEEYQHTHQQILLSDHWIIDGLGSMETLWPRLDAADSLVYIDLPIALHFWWVTKRMVTGFFQPPDGWPERSPILKSSINSYQALWLCHKYLTPRYRKYVKQAERNKSVYHLRSTEQIAHFLRMLEPQPIDDEARTGGDGAA